MFSQMGLAKQQASLRTKTTRPLKNVNVDIDT